MHKGLQIINQVPVLVSLSSCCYVHYFISILCIINFVASRKALYTCHKGWFNKAAVPSKLRVCLKLFVAWRVCRHLAKGVLLMPASNYYLSIMKQRAGGCAVHRAGVKLT